MNCGKQIKGKTKLILMTILFVVVSVLYSCNRESYSAATDADGITGGEIAVKSRQEARNTPSPCTTE